MQGVLSWECSSLKLNKIPASSWQLFYCSATTPSTPEKTIQTTAESDELKLQNLVENRRKKSKNRQLLKAPPAKRLGTMCGIAEAFWADNLKHSYFKSCASAMIQRPGMLSISEHKYWSYVRADDIPSVAENGRYKLRALIVHLGAQSTQSGRYVAYSGYEDGKWQKYNDEVLSEIENIDNQLRTPHLLDSIYILITS
ncbi:hypothetical protein HPB52_015451 [Rhipicephalus sanguineus]|uniref:USP domain-containing protein n=1 Tax=Rhipicephalus sanguineus TaxID=34632 RepID=A0A9D4SSY8_RHISA|nr:hypothetical protein HPB52_015451 [Rhipicephalus sanguineus]